MNIVCKGDDNLVIAVVILKGNLCHGIIPGPRHIDDVFVERALILVDEGDKLPNAPLIVHGLLPLLSSPAVRHQDAHPGIEESLLPHTLMEGIIVVYRVLEHLWVRLKYYFSTSVIRLADHLHLLGNCSPGKLHFIDLTVFVHPHLQPLGKGVDHRRAHPMKTAGYLISAAAKLSSGVKHGIHHLQSGPSGLLLDVHRNAPAIVRDPNHIPVQNLHGDVVAVARQGLINGVIHDLIHQMMETRGRGGSDIHARTLPDRFQPLQHLDFRSIVFMLHHGGIVLFHLFRHSLFPPLNELKTPVSGSPPARWTAGNRTFSRIRSQRSSPAARSFQPHLTYFLKR